MVTRIPRQRRVPQRLTPASLSAQRRTRTTRTIKDLQKRKQDEANYIKQLDQSVSDYLSSVRNLSQLSSEAQKLFDQNVNSVDPRFRGSFRVSIRSKVNQIRQQQNAKISALNSSISNWKKDELRADEKQDKYERGSSQFNRQKAKEAEAFEKQQKAKEVIKRLQQGEIFTNSNISQFITQSGKLASAEETAKLESKKAQLQFRREETKINEFIEKSVKTNKIETVSSIKQRLGISLKEASEVQKIIKKNITTPVNRAQQSKLLDSFSPNLTVRLDYLGINVQQSYSPSAIEKKIENSLFRGGDEIARFNKLNPRDRNLVFSYSILQGAQKDLPSTNRIKSLIEENKQLNLLIDEAKQLQGVKDTKGLITAVNKVLNPKNQITTKDLSRLQDLRGLTNKKIKDILLRGTQADIDKLNKILDSLGKYEKNRKANQQKMLKDLVSKFERKKVTDKIKLAAPYNYVASKAKGLIYNSILTSLNQKLKKKESISFSEYTELRNSVGDLLGLRRVASSTLKKVRSNFGGKGVRNIILGNIKTIMQLHNFTGKVTVATLKIVIRDIAGLFKLLVKVGRTIGKSMLNPFLDAVEFAAAKIRKLPSNERDLFFSRTKQDVKKLKRFGRGVTAIFRNPEMVLLASALLIAKGTVSIRRAIIKRPDKVIAEIISLFLVGEVIRGVSRGVSKVAKTKIIKKIVASLKGLKKTNVAVKGTRVATKTKIAKGIITKASPTKHFRFAIKDLNGKVVFTNKKSLKIIRRIAKQMYISDFSDDMIKNFVKAKRTLRKVIKAKKQPALLKLEKERRVLRREAALVRKKRLPKAKREFIRKGKRKVYSLYDYRTGAVTEYKSRNAWFRDVKKIEKSIQATLGRTTARTESGRFKAFFLNKRGQARLKLVLEKPQLLTKSKVKTKTLRLLRTKMTKIQREVGFLKAVASEERIRKSYIRLLINIVNTIRKIMSAIKRNELEKIGIYIGKRITKEALKKKLSEKLKRKLREEERLKLKAKLKRSLKLKKALKLKKKGKVRQITKTTKIKKPKRKIKRIRITLNWGKKLPRGFNYVVNALVKVEGRIRELKLKTTPNRALKKMIKFIDNTTARSFQLKLIGIKKSADIRKPSLRKFSRKRSKNVKVLDVVEKAKYAIDTRGEKRGLRLGKVLKKRKKPKKKVKRKKKK